MSSTLSCPYCGADTSKEYNFCLSCDRQIKCLHPDCNKVLVPEKSFCFGCGRPVAAITHQQPQNKYVRDVKQEGRNYQEHVEFSISDNAVNALAPFIVGQTIARPPQRPEPPLKHNGSSTSAVPQLPAAVPTLFTDSEEVEEASYEPEPPKAEPVKDGAVRYFKRDGEFLVAMTKDFRGKRWADQQRNFILLYASAYHRIFGTPVPGKEHFRIAASKASVIDASNFSKYLNKLTQKQLSEIGGGFEINDDGEKDVKTIIALMQDEGAEPGYAYWQHSGTSASKKHRMSNDDKARVHEWVAETVNLGSLDIREIKRARDYGMLALWIITIHLKKAEAVRWNDAYYYLKEKYTTVSASPDAFSRAMSNDNNRTYIRESEEHYFLSPEGQQKVEGWIAGKPVETLSEAES